MRSVLRATATALVFTTASSALAQSGPRGARHDFAAERLVAPPTDHWPTNGGNLYNQRYSPLNQINAANVARAQRRMARALARVGCRAEIFGRGATRRARRRRVREHGCERRVRAVDRQRRDSLAVRGESLGGSAVGLLRLEQSRCGRERRQGLHGPARRQARGARSQDRRARLDDSGRAHRGEFLDHAGARLLRRHGHHGFCRRRSRHARPRQSL